MLRILVTLVAATVFGFSHAQSFKLSVGYGIPWISQPIGTNSETAHTLTTNPETGAEQHRVTNTSEHVNGSFGAGFNASGAFTYKLAEHIALELGLTYSAGKEYTTRSLYTDMRMDVLNSMSNNSETSQSRAVLFTPALKFMTHRRTFTPYFSLGPVLGKINFRRSLAETSVEDGIVSSEYRHTKYSGGITLGLRGSVGVSVTVNKNLSWFSEISFAGMNYYAKKSEITSYIINGENRLHTLTKNVTHTNFVRKIATDSNQANDRSNAPGTSLRFPIAMSAISLNVGVVIRLH
jgi:hypothetical protein